MSKTPNFDSKIKAILDATHTGERTCVITGEKWNMDEQEINWYRKFNVPPSKLSPMSRIKLMMGYFVVFDMWYNRHVETGAPLVSTTHPATGIRVLPDEEWFAKDFISQAQDLSLERPFLDQLYELTRSVPQAASFNYVKPENSVAFISLGDQDSYFVLACRSKRSFFCGSSQEIEDCAEIECSREVRESYHIVHSKRIFKSRFLLECYDCLNCDFLFDCRNCEKCFGATNKRNKKYIWMNEQLSEAEWEKRFSAIDLSSQSQLQTWKARFSELMQAESIWPENFNLNTENCTGEYILDSTNIKNGFYVTSGCRDLEYAVFPFDAPSHDGYLTIAPGGSSDTYYSIGTKSCSKTKFDMSIQSRCQEMEYCGSCSDCEYCFGCVGLRHKKFCILNKQYSEEEYWQTLDALKCAMLERGEYGEMPSAKFSTQHWSGCGLRVLFGATKEECLQFGMQDFEARAEGAEGPEIDPSKLQSIDELPDRIENIDEIVGKPFYDYVFKRRFAYVKPELELYKKLGVFPPTFHYTHRMQNLFNQMNMPIYEPYTCAKCQKEVTVGKNPNYPDRRIYCKSCYHQFLEKNG